MKTKFTLLFAIVFGLLLKAEAQFLVCAKGGIGYNSFITKFGLLNEKKTTASNNYFYPMGIDLKSREYKTVNPGISLEFISRSFITDVKNNDLYNTNYDEEKTVYSLKQFAFSIYPEIIVGGNIKYHFNFGLFCGIKLNSSFERTLTSGNSLISSTITGGNGSYLTDINLAFRIGTGAEIPFSKHVYLNFDINGMLGNTGINEKNQNTLMGYSFYTTLGVAYLFGSSTAKKARTEDAPSVLNP